MVLGEPNEPDDQHPAIHSPDELWIIERLPADAPAAAEHIEAGMAADLDPSRDDDALVAMPLRHTAVDADVAGYIASVDVTQTYGNPFDAPIEAVYTFPLPHDAAVNRFVLQVGDRRIHGIVQEKEDAERTYRAARAQGHRASLLTQQRPNVFTQRVANLEPGDDVDVSLRYVHTLPYVDDGFVFHFPMTIGPRYDARGVDVDYIDGARAGAAPLARVDLTVTLDLGVPVRELVSPTHAVTVEQATAGTAGRYVVSLALGEGLPDSDFVLHARVAQAEVLPGLVTHADDRGTFFTAMLLPPTDTGAYVARPMEWVFVIDASGSMNGEPLRQAKDAVAQVLDRLGPGDTLQIVRFSNAASALFDRPAPATRENLARAHRYLDRLRSGGGTEMREGLLAALEDRAGDDARRTRVVCFMTDGFIGNESEVLALVEPRLGDSRVFSFGVGSSPNRYLLEALARLGRGACGYVGQGMGSGPVMDAFYERARTPALTDVALATPNVELTNDRLPDLYAGRPIVVTGRFTGAAPDTLRFTARDAQGPLAITFDLPESPATHAGVASVWARQRIERLSDEQLHAREPAQLAGRITRLALDYGLMSAYTSFVAVDARERVRPRVDRDTGEALPTRTVRQPVVVPRGTAFETARGG